MQKGTAVIDGRYLEAKETIIGLINYIIENNNPFGFIHSNAGHHYIEEYSLEELNQIFKESLNDKFYETKFESFFRNIYTDSLLVDELDEFGEWSESYYGLLFEKYEEATRFKNNNNLYSNYFKSVIEEIDVEPLFQKIIEKKRG